MVSSLIQAHVHERVGQANEGLSDTSSVPGSAHEVVDFIVLRGGALVGHKWVRHCEAVVSGANALRVANGLACMPKFVP